MEEELKENTAQEADASSSGSRQEQLVNVRWHYYSRVKNCPARTGFDDDCICWHLESEGPDPDARHDDEPKIYSWEAR